MITRFVASPKKSVGQLLYEYEKLSEIGDTTWKVSRCRVFIYALFILAGLGLASVTILLGVGILTGVSSLGISVLAVISASLLSIGTAAIVLYNKELSREFAWRSEMLKWKFLSSELQAMLRKQTLLRKQKKLPSIEP